MTRRVSKSQVFWMLFLALPLCAHPRWSL